VETLEFLRRVWPQEGYYCIAVPRTGLIKGEQRSWFDHHVYATIEAAAAKALELDAQGDDVYYALSSLSQPEYYEETKAGRKRRVRTKQNLHLLGTLFLEVDVGEGKDYATAEEALDAVKQFAYQIGWPLPEVVSSGYGLHLYWRLDQPIAARMQDTIADLLKVAADTVGFHLDRQALDCARVFRVVGTHNYKRGGKKPVEMVRPSRTHSPKALYTALKSFCGEHVANTLSRAAISSPSATVQAGFEDNLKKSHAPLNFDGLLRCKQIRETVEENGNVEYGQWWHTIQVIRLCDNGRERAHEISQHGEKYSAADLDKYLDNFEVNDIGPTLCSTFAAKSPGKCDGCPFRGDITSPAKLGRVAVEAAPPVVKFNGKEHVIPVAAEHIEIPNPPFPYVRREGGGIVIRSSRQDGDGEVVQEEEVIFDYDIFPVKRMHHTGQQVETTLWHIEIPTDGKKEVEIAAADLYDKRAFSKAITAKGVYPSTGGIEALRSFMVAYIRLLQQRAKAERKYHTLGWQEDGSFVLGDRVYAKDSIQHCDIVDTPPIDQIKTKGRIEAWCDVLDLYNHDAFVAHQFAFFAGAGSIFTPLSNYEGASIWLHGHSGASKTSIQYLINSVYGTPKGMILSGDPAMSTYNAKITHIATLKNLPTTLDEATRMSREELETFSYTFTQGQNKARLNPDGTMKQDPRKWKAICVLSANEGAYDKLASSQGNSNAKALRIMELYVPVTHVYTKHDFDERYQALWENYGLAGHLIVNWAVNHYEELQAMTQAFKVQFERDAAISAEERYWSLLAVAAMTAFTIMKQLGLHGMRMEPMYDYIVSRAGVNRSTVQTNQFTAKDMLSEYINAHTTQMLVTQEPLEGFAGQGPIVSVMPRGELQMRMDMTTQRLYMAKAPFRDWCTKRGMSATNAITELFTAGVITDRNTRRALGQGTQFATGAVACVEVDMTKLVEGAVSITKLVEEAKHDSLPAH